MDPILVEMPTVNKVSKSQRRRRNRRRKKGANLSIKPSTISFAGTGGINAPLAADLERPKVEQRFHAPSTPGGEAGVTGTDYIGTFYSLSSADLFERFALNPLDDTTFPRLGAIASVWRRYKFKRIRFWLFGIAAATQPGFVAMASLVTDDLAKEVLPTNEGEILNMENCAVGRPWSVICHDVGCQDAGLQWYTADSTPSDASTFGQALGNAFLYIPTTTTDKDIPIQIWIEYEVDFCQRVAYEFDPPQNSEYVISSFAQLSEDIGTTYEEAYDSQPAALIWSMNEAALADSTNIATEFADLYGGFTSYYNQLVTLGDVTVASTVKTVASQFLNAIIQPYAGPFVLEALPILFGQVLDESSKGTTLGSRILAQSSSIISTATINALITALGGTPGPLDVLLKLREEAFARETELSNKAPRRFKDKPRRIKPSLIRRKYLDPRRQFVKHSELSIPVRVPTVYSGKEDSIKFEQPRQGEIAVARTCSHPLVRETYPGGSSTRIYCCDCRPDLC
jgi:hypothetical protein